MHSLPDSFIYGQTGQDACAEACIEMIPASGRDNGSFHQISFQPAHSVPVTDITAVSWILTLITQLQTVLGVSE